MRTEASYFSVKQQGAAQLLFEPSQKGLLLSHFVQLLNQAAELPVFWRGFHSTFGPWNGVLDSLLIDEHVDVAKNSLGTGRTNLVRDAKCLLGFGSVTALEKKEFTQP